MKKLKTLLLSTALAVSPNLLAKTTPVTIYAEEFFSADWGPAPVVKAQFEQKYPQCQANIVPFDSRTTLLNRVRLEGKNTQADIVIGLDNFQLEPAEKSGLFVANQVDLNQLSLPIPWQNHTFLPYDFGQYAFIYDKNKLTNPPQSLAELIERQDLKVIYQDPRTSSIGRGLLVWLNLLYPEEQIPQRWQQLASHTVTVGKGWTETYGAFLKGEADLVMSHNTSPIYHLLQENKDQYAATEFSDPVLLQVEMAAKTIKGKDNLCAEHFLGFLLSPEAQQEISRKNVMLSVTDAKVDPLFDQLKAKQLNTKTLDSSTVSAEQIKQWINVWQAALIK